MTDRELRRLRRGELLELLLAQMKENDALRARVDALEAQVNDRTICVKSAGSMAEASMRLSGVYEAAQASADLYLENVRRLEADAEEAKNAACAEAERVREEARAEAGETLLRAKAEAEAIVAAAEAEAEKRTADATAESAACWHDVRTRVDFLSEEREGLKEILSTLFAKTE